MNQSKRAISRAAVQAAIMLLIDDSDSSDSDDDVEMLVMKTYLKYKAKRRKLLPGNCSNMDEEHTKNSDVPVTNSEDYVVGLPDSEEQPCSPKARPTHDMDALCLTNESDDQDSNEELIVLDESNVTNELQTGANSTLSVKQPFQLHVSNIFFSIPDSLASRILSDEDFRNHFKLSRSSVEDLVRSIKNNRPARCTGRPMMPPEKAILIFLWFLGTSESYTAISERFDIRKSVVYAAFAHTCQSVSALKEMHIKWPTGDDALKVVQGFEADTSPQFPGVIGCLGATHISISEPKDSNFLNRADYNSVILQAACDASGAFIDVFTGWPGSASHTHVWLYSPLYGELQANPDFLPGDTHLLADEAYPLSKNLMVPFPNTATLTPAETHFNDALHLKLAILDQAFAHLKHRFQRLNFLNVHIVENIKFITLAACVCHNIATREDGQWDDTEDVGEDEGLLVPRVGDEEEVAVSEEVLEKRASLSERMYTCLATQSIE